MERVNVAEKLASFQKTWSPKIIAELNGQYVKVVKTDGEYVWHHHDDEDELFYVLKGSIVLQVRDQPDVTLAQGEMAVVPRGVEHCPSSHGVSYILVFEPKVLVSSGD